MNILVTVGTPNLGSRICVESINAVHRARVFDKIFGPEPKARHRVIPFTGGAHAGGQVARRDMPAPFETLFICDGDIPLAGLEPAGDSVQVPLICVYQQVASTHSMLRARSAAKVLAQMPNSTGARMCTTCVD